MQQFKLSNPLSFQKSAGTATLEEHTPVFTEPGAGIGTPSRLASPQSEGNVQEIHPAVITPFIPGSEYNHDIYLPYLGVALDQAQKRKPSTQAAATNTSVSEATQTAPITTTPQPSKTNTPMLTPTSTRTHVNLELSYLLNGDVWLMELPSGTPHPFTSRGDVQSYAWTADGARLAIYNGSVICFFNQNGLQIGSCLDLGLTESQRNTNLQIVWSPDAKMLVVWNPDNRFGGGEDTVGWIIISLEHPNDTIRIQDPVDFGFTIHQNTTPGGITGMPLFLPNGKLLGTFSHTTICGSGSCRFLLQEYDLTNNKIIPFNNNVLDGWSEGQYIELSGDRKWIANFSVFHIGCELYNSQFDEFNLETSERRAYQLRQESISDISLSPDGQSAAIARTAGCSSQNSDPWAQTCGLSSNFDVYPIQSWDLAANQRNDLSPGLSPNWSHDGTWIAFRSCLTYSDQNTWQPDGAAAPSIFITNPNGSIIKLISKGSMPTWRP